MLAWHLALRYLRKRRAAWLALAAITLTVGVSVMVVGVAQGGVELTRRQVRSNEADLTALGPFGARVKDGEAARRLLAAPGVAAVGPFAQNYGLLIPDRRRDAVPVQVDGVDWAADSALGRLHAGVLHPAPVFDLAPRPLAPDARGTGFLTPAWRDHLALAGLDAAAGLGVGFLPPPPRKRPVPGAVVGRELMYMNGLAVGDEVVLVGPDATGGPPPRERVEISDTIGTGLLEVDKLAVIAPLPQVRRLLGLKPGEVDGWRLALEPGADPAAIAADLRRDSGLRVMDWMERRGSFVRSLEQQRLIMGVVMVLVQVIAVFIVYAVFSTLVVEKRHDLGVLRGLGARRRALAGAFLLAGAIASLGGGLLGWALGWAGLAALNPVSAALGVPLFPQDVFYTAQAPISFDWCIPLFFLATQTTIGLLAVLVPAWQATRVDPIACLRGDA
ncbi:MAG: hypothetical protein RLZZ127_302 [Planctomycetota bacterium]|jgi:ABC-type lipoprotein release transport system permease subunit